MRIDRHHMTLSKRNLSAMLVCLAGWLGCYQSLPVDCCGNPGTLFCRSTRPVGCRAAPVEGTGKLTGHGVSVMSDDGTVSASPRYNMSQLMMAEGLKKSNQIGPSHIFPPFATLCPYALVASAIQCLQPYPSGASPV